MVGVHVDGTVGTVDGATTTQSLSNNGRRNIVIIIALTDRELDFEPQPDLDRLPDISILPALALGLKIDLLLDLDPPDAQPVEHFRWKTRSAQRLKNLAVLPRLINSELQDSFNLFTHISYLVHSQFLILNARRKQPSKLYASMAGLDDVGVRTEGDGWDFLTG
jgi:hypothetical protein